MEDLFFYTISFFFFIYFIIDTISFEVTISTKYFSSIYEPSNQISLIVVLNSFIKLDNKLQVLFVLGHV